MKFAALLFAQYAKSDDGTLTVVGGGVNQVEPEAYPCPMRVWVAMILHIEPLEIGHEHELEVLVVGPEEKQVARIEIAFTTGRKPGVPEDEPGQALITLDLSPIALAGPGTYTLRASVEGATAEIWLVGREATGRQAPETPSVDPEAATS